MIHPIDSSDGTIITSTAPPLMLMVVASCLGSPVRARYGGVLRDDAVRIFRLLSRFIWHSACWTICYLPWPSSCQRHEYYWSCLLLWFSTFHQPHSRSSMKFYVYAVLIQDIWELICRARVRTPDTHFSTFKICELYYLTKKKIVWLIWITTYLFLGNIIF